MKKLTCFLSALVLCGSGILNAQTNLAGTWEGTLAVDAATQITVQFILEASGDTYTAVLNAPDQPNLRNVAVTALNLTGNTLRMAVDSVSGVYEGAVAEGAITGTWTQQGATFTLNLQPYSEPALAAADMERLSGSWVGELRPIPNGDMVIHVVFHFDRDEAGEFKPTFDSPDEGAFGLALDSVGMKGDALTVSLNRARMEFTGTLSADGIAGEWNQMGRKLPLNLRRGEVEVAGLELSAEAFARLQGAWHGKIGPLNVVFRFAEEDGKHMGYMDSPDQGAANIPLTTASVDGNQLTLSISAVGGSYTAEIGADNITGQWTQMSQNMPLTLERGLYQVNASVPVAARQQLNGVWRGTVNNTNLVFRFENGDSGLAVFLDIPAMNANGLPINDVRIEGDRIQFTVVAINASFSGSLGAADLNGEWSRAGVTNPLMLAKD